MRTQVRLIRLLRLFKLVSVPRPLDLVSFSDCIAEGAFEGTWLVGRGRERRGKLLGKIAGENCWGKLLGKIAGENVPNEGASRRRRDSMSKRADRRRLERSCRRRERGREDRRSGIETSIVALDVVSRQVRIKKYFSAWVTAGNATKRPITLKLVRQARRDDAWDAQLHDSSST
eukprot:2457904-Pleurochrysis_carterae.AAC.3